MLLYLAYLERDAWRVGDVQVPEVERRLLSQRILNDIQYVEKEAFQIIRKPGDQFYIEADTAAEERLQRLRGRTTAMWESWYHGGQKKDLDRPLHRRWQTRPVDQQGKTSRPQGPHPLLEWLRTVLRTAAAFVAESRMCQIILEHYPRRFVRSLENARTDGGLLLDDFFDHDQESLERHSRLESCSEGTPPFLPVEIKHGVAGPNWSGDPTLWRQAWRLSGSHWGEDKRQGILIFTSAIDPDRVVICPATAFFQGVPAGTDGGKLLVGEREAVPWQTCPPAFPSNLKPYEIPVSDIGEVLSLLLKCAHDGTKVWSVVVKVDGLRSAC